MELILWRHAEAHDGMPDLARELTENGRRQAARMATFLRARLPEDTRILVSPAVRTQQTAQALTKHFHIEPALAPGASVPEILDTVGWPDSDRAVLVVGHQPVLGLIAARLLADSGSGFRVRKGAVWWLSQRTSAGDFQTHLRLVIAPDFL